MGGLTLGLAQSATAVPYVVNFTATETDPQGASDYVLYADIFGNTDSSFSSRVIFYDVLTGTFFTDKTPFLPNETFVAAAGSNMFQLLYTFDDPEGFSRNFSLSNHEEGPQGFANAVFSGAVENPNDNSLGVSFDYTVTAAGLPASVTFDLTDPGNGGIFVSAAATGAPELDPRAGVSVGAMLLAGYLLLAGRRAAAARPAL